MLLDNNADFCKYCFVTVRQTAEFVVVLLLTDIIAELPEMVTVGTAYVYIYVVLQLTGESKTFLH
jgi:hypothetical protein